MASYNRVIMMGNLTRDPELKQLSSGQSVCRLGLASNRQFKNRQTDTMVQEVCFVDVDVWGAQAESCNQYLQKGRLVLIEGRLKLDTWQDPDGNRRSKHFIVADRVTFLSSSAQQGDEVSSQDAFQNQNVTPAVSAQPKVEVASSVVRPLGEDSPTVSASGETKQEEQSAETKPNTGELNFKDEKPFEDDLPF